MRKDRKYMLKKNLIKFVVSIFLLLFSSNSMAADETIEMLNKLGKESMVFPKKILRHLLSFKLFTDLACLQFNRFSNLFFSLLSIL